MIEFWRTGYGRRFFEAQLPQLIEAIEALAKATDKLVTEIRTDKEDSDGQTPTR